MIFEKVRISESLRYRGESYKGVRRTNNTVYYISAHQTHFHTQNTLFCSHLQPVQGIGKSVANL